MYVIKKVDCTSPQGFVAVLGHIRSYTYNMRYVRFFTTRADAEREACGNDQIIEVTGQNRGVLTW